MTLFFWSLTTMKLTPLLIAALAGCAAPAAPDRPITSVTVAGDRMLGNCATSAILADFFKQAPPSAGRFTVEADIDPDTDEIYAYYGGMPEDQAKTAWYDSKDCRFLRLEPGTPAKAKQK